MKKILAAGLMVFGTQAMAVAPGGPDCGWGNMIFEGKSGFPAHFLGSSVNGTSGNATFGMTTGTNGCSYNGTLTYGGTPMVNLAPLMDEIIADAAHGEGEALNALAVTIGIEKQDRDDFAQAVHNHFADIFVAQDMTSEQVYQNIFAMMSQDEVLSKYSVGHI